MVNITASDKPRALRCLRSISSLLVEVSVVPGGKLGLAEADRVDVVVIAEVERIVVVALKTMAYVATRVPLG